MVAVKCYVCQKEIFRYPRSIKKTPSGIFYCSRECNSFHHRTGHIHPDGYAIDMILGDRTPNHRRAMENHLGRKLLPHEHVHHINGDKLDNRIENLLVLDRASHRKEHAPLSFDINLAISLLKEGLPTKEVAARTGTTYHVLTSALDRRGFTINQIRGKKKHARI